MRFARWVFLVAGISGVVMISPMYFLEEQVGRYQSPVNHAEFYYGFVGVTLAWQLLFLVIAVDPHRYRLAMLPALVEKASFAIAIPILYALNRVSATLVYFGSMDAIWFVLFAVGWWKTRGVRPWAFSPPT
jgi:hypothetical protein